MVSFTTFSAAAVLAFSGMASAIPAYNGTSPYGNGTMTSALGSAGVKPSGTTGSLSTGTTNGTVSATGAASDSLFCPRLNGATATFGGKTYLIECGRTHFGTILSVSVSRKRATYNTLGDCADLCSATTTCVGTAFDLNLRTCTLYSDVQAGVDATGIDFAILVSTGTGDAASTSAGADTGAGAAASTVSAGGVLTIPVYSTTVKTVLSCAPTVTNCPLRNNGGSGVVTELIPVTSTLYTCPAATTVPVTPLACSGCPYQPVTATQYSASVSSGTTTFVPVKTNVINSPMPSGTQVTVTVCTKCAASTATGGSGSGSSVATGSTTKPTMAVYTGAAGQVKAGMGFAAFVAGAAILI